MHDLFEPISRDERQAQALKAWIKAKGHGTIVGCTGFGFIKAVRGFLTLNRRSRSNRGIFGIIIEQNRWKPYRG